MTRQEKFEAICQRLKSDVFSEPEAVSMFLLAHHMWKLDKQGYVTAPHKITTSGENVVALCEEFDWEIEDSEILEYCKEFMIPDQVLPVFNLLKKICDKGTLTNG
jgi:sulfur relay (sulfurtransferase) DsrC/TusE family protein